MITLDFDPLLRFDGRAVRWETLGIALAVLAGILLAGMIAGGTPPDAVGRRLRRDDLLFLVLGVVPGAVIGGRLGYGLLHLDYYGGHPGALLDAGAGGFQLSVGVAFGALTGAYVARLIEAPVGRWLHAATLPVFLTLALGKAAMALGGSGQGGPSSAAWATSYLGAGPWGSLAPAVASHPAQLYEAGMMAAVVIALAGLLAAGAFASRDGRAFGVGLALWAVVRFIVGFAWRDSGVVGPIRADQLLSVALFACSIALVAVIARSASRAASGAASGAVDGRPGYS